jgi:hypothetical protein
MKTKLINEINTVAKIKHDNIIKIPGFSECSNDCSIDFFTKENEFYVKIHNGNKTCTAKYELLGTFDLTTSTWYWSHLFNPHNPQTTLISKNINENMKIFIENKKIKLTQYDLELVTFFCRNSIYIERENLEILIKLCLFLSDVQWIMPYRKIDNTPSKIDFIIIKQIIQIV